MTALCIQHQYNFWNTVQPLIWAAPNTKTEIVLVSYCSYLCPIRWSQLISREWRCSWSSADRRCSNYIWVTTIVIAYQDVCYVKRFHGRSYSEFGCRLLTQTIPMMWHQYHYINKWYFTLYKYAEAILHGFCRRQSVGKQKIHITHYK